MRFVVEDLTGFDRSETGQGLMQVFFLSADAGDKTREGQARRFGIEKLRNRTERQHMRPKKFGAETTRGKGFSPLIKESMLFG